MSLDEGQEDFCHRPTAGISKTEGYSKQAGYERRRAIVERLHETLHDMPLLVSGTRRDLRTEAFGDGDLDGKEHTLNVLSWSFALLYLRITDTVEPSDLARTLSRGLPRAVLDRHTSSAGIRSRRSRSRLMSVLHKAA